MNNQVLRDLAEFLDSHGLEWDGAALNCYIFAPSWRPETSPHITLTAHLNKMDPENVRTLKRVFGPFKQGGKPPYVSLKGEEREDIVEGAIVICTLMDAFKCENTGYVERVLTSDEQDTNDGKADSLRAELRALEAKTTVKETSWSCLPIQREVGDFGSDSRALNRGDDSEPHILDHSGDLD